VSVLKAKTLNSVQRL